MCDFAHEVLESGADLTHHVHSDWVDLINPAPRHQGEVVRTLYERVHALEAPDEWAGARFEDVDQPAKPCRDWKQVRWLAQPHYRWYTRPVYGANIHGRAYLRPF